MDIGLREWLIVIGIIVIAGILFDGWRRMSGGKGKLKFKLDRSFSNAPDEDEDPNLLGPARVKDHAHQEPSLDEGDLPALSAREAGKRRGEPQQGDLNLDLDEPVPTLLNPVDEGKKNGKPHPQVQVQEVPVEEVLVINVVARDESGFKGPALLQNILE